MTLQRLPFDKIEASSGRIPGLDGLRALSILIVMGGHFFLSGAGGFAALGVYIFFAISGFLITRLLFLEQRSNGRVSAKHFYIRRFLRLYPVILSYLAFILCLSFARGDKTDSVEVSSVLFYFTNYLMSFKALHGQEVVMQIGVLWSLAIEEHFYLIAPLFFIAVGGRIRPMLWFAGLSCFIPLVLRCLYVVLWPEIIGQLVTYHHSETRFDSIAVGVLLAILCESRARERAIRILSSRIMFALAFVTVAVCVAIHNPVFKETIRFSLISFACLPLICGIVFGQGFSLIQNVANSRPAVWIGKLSYSLYVWHGCSTYGASLLGVDGTGVKEGLFKLALSFLAASLSYYLIESPFLRLRALFAPPSK